MADTSIVPILLFCLFVVVFLIAAFVVLPRLFLHGKTGLGREGYQNYFKKIRPYADGTDWSDGYRVKWPKNGRW